MPTNIMNVIARIDNPQDIQTTFKEGKADIILVFGDHFGENFRHTGDASVQLITDGTDPNTASYADGICIQCYFIGSAGIKRDNIKHH